MNPLIPKADIVAALLDSKDFDEAKEKILAIVRDLESQNRTYHKAATAAEKALSGMEEHRNKYDSFLSAHMDGTEIVLLRGALAEADLDVLLHEEI